MKILYVNVLYTPFLYGGAERSLQTLAEGMVARGHDVTVLTTGPNTGLNEDYVNGVHVLRTGVRNLYWRAMHNKLTVWKRSLWHLVDMYNAPMGQIVSNTVYSIKPDIVSLHNLPGFSVSAWNAVWQAHVPMVQVLHDQYLLCPRCTMFKDDHVCEHQCLSCRAMRLFHPRLSKKVDAVVGVSEFILDHHIQHGYFRETATKCVIHNVRNNAQALAVPRRVADGTIRFGFIGTLDKSKGIELLLRVFKEIAKDNWHLHIAGSGSAEYEKYLHDSYAASNVVFHGVQEPMNFYPVIDVLVVPSIWNDTLPGVVFEGLSYGVPIVGTRRGGIPEMIEDGANGLLFDPDQPEELKTVMMRMAEDDEFRISASLSARVAAPYYLDMDRFISSYEELYREMCMQQTDV